MIKYPLHRKMTKIPFYRENDKKNTKKWPNNPCIYKMTNISLYVKLCKIPLHPRVTIIVFYVQNDQTIPIY